MTSRLLLFILTFHSGVLLAQNDETFAISVGPEVSHFAQATPGYLSADFHINHKKSLFVIGYAVPLYQQEFIDNDHITPTRMRIPMLNAFYTYRFIQPYVERKLSIGTSIGYKFGHWRSHGDIQAENFYNGTFLDTSLTQVTQVTHQEKRESDQHHFLIGIYAEYPLKTIRFIASCRVGVAFQSSYHFDDQITYYNTGEPQEIRMYKDVTPFQYVSASWHLKLGVLVPISFFQRFINT